MQALGLAEARGKEPEWRQAHAVAALRGAGCEANIIIHGGQAPNNRHLDDMYYFHAHLREWNHVPYATDDRPLGRTLHTLTAVSSSKLVLFGGSTAIGSHAVRDLNDVWEFSWRSRTWTKRHTSGESPSPRSGHTAVVGFARDRSPSIFVFGGTRNDSAVYRLNINTWSWSRLGFNDLHFEVPAPRECHAAVWVDSLKSMVISCGSSLLVQDGVIPKKEELAEQEHLSTPGNEKSRNDGENYLADVWLFTNTSKNLWTWTQLKLKGFEHRQGHSSFLLPSSEPRIAIWGGITYPKGRINNDIFMKDFTIIDLSTQIFSVHPVRNAYKHNLFGRLNHAVARVNEKLLVFAGLGPRDQYGTGFPPSHDYRIQQGIMQLEIDNAVLYNSKRDGCHCPLGGGEKVTQFNEEDQRPVKGRILQREDGILLVSTVIDNKLFIGELVPDYREADANLTHDKEREDMTGMTPARTPGRVRFDVPPTAPKSTSKAVANGEAMRPSSSGVLFDKSGKLNMRQHKVFGQSAAPAVLAEGSGRSLSGKQNANSASGLVSNVAQSGMSQTAIGANSNIASGREGFGDNEFAKRLAAQMSTTHKATALSETRQGYSGEATALNAGANKAPIIQPNKQPRVIPSFDKALQDQRVKIAMQNAGLLNKPNSAGAQSQQMAKMQHEWNARRIAGQDLKRSAGSVDRSRQQTHLERNEQHSHQQKKPRTGQTLEQRVELLQSGNLQSQNILTPQGGPTTEGIAQTNVVGNHLASATETAESQIEVVPMTEGPIARPSHSVTTGSATPVAANTGKAMCTTSEAPTEAGVGQQEVRPVEIMGEMVGDPSAGALTVQMSAAAEVPMSEDTMKGGVPTHSRDMDMVDVEVNEKVKTSAGTAQGVSGYDAAVDALPDSPDNDGDIPVILLD